MNVKMSIDTTNNSNNNNKYSNNIDMNNINKYNNINNMSKDGGTHININNNNDDDDDNNNSNDDDDFDFIDYEVLPISNRKIDARLHESALRMQEEGQSFKQLPAFLATKKVLARSRRRAELARIRLNPNHTQRDDTSKDDDKPLPLTPKAFHTHLRLEREKATRLEQLCKDAALMAPQEASSWMIQQREAKRRLSLVSAAAAAAGRSRYRKHQQRQRRQVLPQLNSTATILSYEDVRDKSTAQLLGMLLELRDSSDHLMYAMVQGELGARMMETQVTAFHAFLQCEDDKALRAITAVTAEDTTDDNDDDDNDDKLLQQDQGQAQAQDPRLEEEEGYECYDADNEASLLSKNITDLDTWDPPLLPSLRKHIERLPIGTLTQFFEDLRAMNEFKTEQARRHRTIFRWTVAGMACAVLIAMAMVAGFPFVNSACPTTILDHQIRATSVPSLEPTVTSQLRMLHWSTNVMQNSSSIAALGLPLQVSQSEARHSLMIYSKSELLLPAWAHRHSASMALSTIVSPRALAIVPQQAARIIATNIMVNASEELLIHSKSQPFGSSSDLSIIVSPRALAIYHMRARIIPPSMVNSTAGLFWHSMGTFRQPALPTVLLSSVVCPTDLCAQTTSTEQTFTLNRAQRWNPASTALSAIVSSRMIPPSMVNASTALSTIASPRVLTIHHKRVSMNPPISVNSTIGLFVDSAGAFWQPEPPTVLLSSIARPADSRFEVAGMKQTLHRVRRSPASATLSIIARPPSAAPAMQLVDHQIQKSQASSKQSIIVNQRDLIHVARAQRTFARVLGVVIHQPPPYLLPAPPDPPPRSLLLIIVSLWGPVEIQGAGFWGCQGVGVLSVAYLVTLPLPPPEPPPPFLHLCLAGTCMFEMCAVQH